MACARYGTSYVASIFFAAEESAASTSPSLRTRLALPSSATAACIAALSFALVSSLAPSHLTSSASRPFIAAHVDVAMTPTPLHGASAPCGSMATTCFTPGTAFAFVASKLATFAPNAGARRTLA